MRLRIVKSGRSRTGRSEVEGAEASGEEGMGSDYRFHIGRQWRESDDIVVVVMEEARISRGGEIWGIHGREIRVAEKRRRWRLGFKEERERGNGNHCEVWRLNPLARTTSWGNSMWNYFQALSLVPCNFLELITFSLSSFYSLTLKACEITNLTLF